VPDTPVGSAIVKTPPDDSRNGFGYAFNGIDGVEDDTVPSMARRRLR